MVLLHFAWKLMSGRLVPFWDCLFLRAMFSFRCVSLSNCCNWRKTPDIVRWLAIPDRPSRHWEPGWMPRFSHVFSETVWEHFTKSPSEASNRKQSKFQGLTFQMSWMSQFFNMFHPLDRSTDGFRALAWSPDCSRLVARYLRFWEF